MIRIFQTNVHHLTLVDIELQFPVICTIKHIIYTVLGIYLNSEYISNWNIPQLCRVPCALDFLGCGKTKPEKYYAVFKNSNCGNVWPIWRRLNLTKISGLCPHSPDTGRPASGASGRQLGKYLNYDGTQQSWDIFLFFARHNISQA